MSRRIRVANGIIPTIGKHVIAQDALAGRNKCICIDESTQLGIIIAGLKIVETGLSVVELTVDRKVS